MEVISEIEPSRRTSIKACIVILSEAKNLVLYPDDGNKYQQGNTNSALAAWYTRDWFLTSFRMTMDSWFASL